MNWPQFWSMLLSGDGEGATRANCVLHQVQPGGADRSYGIEAGRLAGLPAPVIQRAKQVMGQIENCKITRTA